MNKKRAIDSLEFLHKWLWNTHSDTHQECKDALDFAIKELSKPEKAPYNEFVEKYSKYSQKKSDISKVLPELVKASLRVPPFAWTCTCCWESTQPQYSLCNKHYNSWLSSRWTRANYRWLVNIDSPKEVRDWYNIGDIYENKGKCPKCGYIIESLNHYDYQKCSCGHSFIDGGSDYSRRNPDLIDMTVFFNK